MPGRRPPGRRPREHARRPAPAHPAPAWRLALAVALGAVAVLTGVGLMTLAGYLISRCAEQPPVLSLTVAIVGVRAFGITRPLARYAHRLVSHDLALRTLAGTRAATVRSLAGQLPDRSGADRDGDLLARLVGDVDAVQDLYLRGLIPPLVALASGAVSVAVATALLPAAGAVLAAGLVVGGVLVPILAAALGGAIARRQTARARRAHRRARRVRARRARAGRARRGPRRGRADRAAGRRADRGWAAGAPSPAGWWRGSRCSSPGSPWPACSPSASARRRSTPRPGPRRGPHAARRGRLRGRRPAAAGGAHAARDAGVGAPRPAGRARPPAVTRPGAARATPGARARSSSTRSGCGPQDADGWGLRGVDLALAPGDRVALVGRSGSGKTTLAELMVRFLDPDDGRVLLAGTDVRELAPARGAPADHARRAGRLPVLDLHPRERAARPPGRRRRRRRGGAAPGPAGRLGGAAARRARTRSSARTARRSPAASAAGWRWPGPCSPTRPCWSWTNRRRTSTVRPRRSSSRTSWPPLRTARSS